ncbi:hypothetical protein [Mangrovibacterium sp.]|uniref:hypothetical protein n=1 Tax=Mangrovibacterium sp. TaxID=1961364 RepID=UPI00356578AF
MKYIYKYDEFKRFLDDKFEMPDKLVATFVRFLAQNNGVLSKRALSNEFSSLKENEVEEIEKEYKDIFEVKNKKLL